MHDCETGSQSLSQAERVVAEEFCARKVDKLTISEFDNEISIVVENIDSTLVGEGVVIAVSWIPFSQADFCLASKYNCSDRLSVRIDWEVDLKVYFIMIISKSRLHY